jgi:hypothetical protein
MRSSCVKKRVETKICLDCRQELPLDNFYSKRQSQKGSYCKLCHCVRTRANYQEKIDHYRQAYKVRASTPEYKKRTQERKKNRKAKDPLFKLTTLLRCRLHHILSGRIKSMSTEEMLGCSWEEAKKHLEKQFSDGMSWENHGVNGWHIDHIIPLSSANTLEELKNLFHYTNLQPLWAFDNLSKGNKII